MEFFYYDNQDNTVNTIKPICILHIYIYIYIYIKYIIYIFDLFIILSIASRNSFLVYNRQNYIPNFTSTTQI